MSRKDAFTLIELLIVVAIIAILAAIAVPNFLEAQVRSKVVRCKADMRAIHTALETYFTDHNKYPSEKQCGFLVKLMYPLTTPIAYISSVQIDDPFNPTRVETYYDPAGGSGNQVGRSYTYVPYFEEWAQGYYPNFIRMGAMLHGWGPSSYRVNMEHYAGLKQFQDITYGWTDLNGQQVQKPQYINIVYNPTNGTKSYGGIARSIGNLNCEVVIGG